MHSCVNCGPLPDSDFSIRNSKYFPNKCRKCERASARDRRRACYADPHTKVLIQNQNSIWRSKQSTKSSKSRNSSEEFHDLISDLHETGYLPKSYDINSIFHRLKKSRVSPILPQSYIGLDYLDLNFKHRFSVASSGCQSFHDVFYDKSEILKVIEYLKKENKHVTNDAIIRNLKFNIFMPSHFLPDAAAAIINRFGLNKDVFDPFLGWGGRTLGAVCAGAKSITGTDLQLDSVAGCQKIVNDFFPLSKCRSLFVNSNFSDFMNETDLHFDLIFTSPPFIDTEDYGVGSYGSVDRWIHSIVIPLTRGCSRVLRHDGRVAIHVQEKSNLPVMSSVLSCFCGAGWSVVDEYKYGRKSGQKVLIFKR